jgi:hypothetical protein
VASHLLGSLRSVLHEVDEGIAEALRRDAEFEANTLLLAGGVKSVGSANTVRLLRSSIEL